MRASNRQRVVVTGLGAVSAFGWGVGPLRTGLASGRTAIGPTVALDTSDQRTRVAGEAPPAPAVLAASFPGWHHLTRAERFALAATQEARSQAGCREDQNEVGVFFGGSTGGMLECEEYVARLLGRSEGRPRLTQVASQQINAPGDAVARFLGARGLVQTLSSACASGSLAIGAAVDALRRGETELAFAGGADELCRLTYSGFNALRSVDERPCRPFRADRSGLSIGEGAGVLVLEGLDHARFRGARPLAELLGWGASCDAHHMTAPHPHGAGAAAAVTAALADAGVATTDVALVNAHGTGTPHNDLSEARALAAVLGERAGVVPVTANKGAIGHLLGCSGAIEAVATVLALLDGAVQPTAGDGAPDPELGIDLVLGTPRTLPPAAVAISTSLAFGGANAALVLAAWTEEW